MQSIQQKPRGSQEAKPQLKLVSLTPRAKRMLDAIVERGEDAFNKLSTQDIGLLSGIHYRNKICEARQELERAGYITTERVGNRVLIHLNPEKALPADLPGFQHEELLGRCIEVDNLEARGSHTDRHSAFQMRRREQIALFREVWAFFFPHDAPPSEANIRYALTLCGDSLEEFFKKMESIAFDTKEIAFRNNKRTHIRQPRAYVLKSLERHAREVGRHVQSRKAWWRPDE